MQRLCVLATSLARAARLSSGAATVETDGVFIAKLLAGREIADPASATSRRERELFTMAQNMQNQQFLVGDAATGEAVVVDGNYDPAGIERVADAAGYRIVGYVATHFHWDHIGSAARGVEGMAHWVRRGVPAHIHAVERDAAAAQIGVDAADIEPYADGDAIAVGRVALRVVHTPGHSPGSAVLVVAGASGAAAAALAGDTVFAGSCGRLDLEGSSVAAMYDSLAKLRRVLDDDALPLFPGHAYGAEATTVGAERAGGLLGEMTRARWHAMMGA